MAYQYFYVTPSGSTAQVKFLGMDKHPHRDGERHFFALQSPAGDNQTVNVTLVAPSLIDAALQQHGLPPFVNVNTDLTHLAAVTSFDRLARRPTDAYGRRGVEGAPPSACPPLP